MNILKPLVKLSAVLFFIGASAISQAAPFTVTYTDTIDAGSDSPPFNIGEAFTISIVLDNGGTTTASQTWTSADIVSVTLSMNDAPNTITTTLSPVVLSTATGSFATDAAGVLTTAPSDWVDSNQASTVQSTNDPNVTIANPGVDFFINDGNDVYFSGPGQNIAAGMTNVANNTIAAFWSNPVAAMSTPTSVPTLSQWSLILLSLILVAYGVVRTRRVY